MPPAVTVSSRRWRHFSVAASVGHDDPGVGSADAAEGRHDGDRCSRNERNGGVRSWRSTGVLRLDLYERWHGAQQGAPYEDGLDAEASGPVQHIQLVVFPNDCLATRADGTACGIVAGTAVVVNAGTGNDVVVEVQHDGFQAAIVRDGEKSGDSSTLTGPADADLAHAADVATSSAVEEAGGEIGAAVAA